MRLVPRLPATRVPERTTGALAEAAYGMRLTHSTYKTIMEVTAGETIPVRRLVATSERSLTPDC